MGVPFPPLAIELVRFSVGPRNLQRALYDAAVHSMEDALELGFVDELVEAEELEERAIETARRLAAIPPTSFSFTKRRTREVLRGPGLDPAACDEVRALWQSEEIAGALAEYVARTLG